MSTDPFIGEIKIFGFNFAPIGHLNCNGQIMSIREYTALYALLGTFYGGDGTTTFALPDLRGRTAINQGELLINATNYRVDARGGVTEVTLLTPNIPAHAHALANAQVQLNVNNGIADETLPQGNHLGSTDTPIYSGNGGTAGAFLAGGKLSGTTDPTGANIPLNIQNPYLTVNFCIATEGLFPTRS